MRDQIVAEARTYLGVPFVHQGRGTAGIDCAGVVIKCAHALGLSSFDIRSYRRVPDGKEMLRLCREQMVEIDPATVRPGDVLLFRGDFRPRHLAIVGDHPCGGLSIIHAHYESGKVVEFTLDHSWRSKIVAAFRLPGVA